MAELEQKKAEAIKRMREPVTEISNTTFDEYQQKAVAGIEELEKKFADKNYWSFAALDLLAEYQLSGDPAPEAVRINDLLLQTGLRDGDVHNALLSWVPDGVAVNPLDWGLDSMKLPPHMLDDDGLLPLPAGLAVPWFEGTECVALSIRPATDNGSSFFLPCQSWTMPGSKAGVQVIGAISPKPVLLTVDPLTAWLLYAQVGDLFAIILCTDSSADMPESARGALADAPCVFWTVSPLPADQAEDGLAPVSESFSRESRDKRIEELAGRWQAVLPLLSEQQPLLPLAWPEKWAAPNLAAAAALGLDIRAWLRDELEQHGQSLPPENGSLEIVKDKRGRPKMEINVPQVDVQGIRSRLQKRIDKITHQMDSRMEEARQELRTRAEKVIAQWDLPPLDLHSPTLEEVRNKPFPCTPDPEMLKGFDGMEERMLKLKGPEEAAKVRELRKRYVEDLQKLGKLDEEGRAALRKHRELFAKPDFLSEKIPDWVKDVPGAEAALQ
ncbi:MAG: hypothetical protein Q4F72_12820, partial [Desulfovibrionaceae bacterium]|nr:hypothetical protein [Desulfovibrionaceae bacterium]